MRDLFIFNSLTRKPQKFEPREKGKVGMYVCGITPYDYCHLGHARCYVAFDVIRRTLKRFGYDVTYIQNFTDVDDKIINRAKELKEDPKVLAERYIADYTRQMGALNVLPADQYPRVTGHIPEIQALIGKLIEKGMAYAVGTGVYYSVRKFEGYGRLSGRNLDDMRVGARVEGEADKKDPHDFALWKRSTDPSELAWDSPWGRGRPGWHIECSAMSMKYLGEEFDIHGGGQDLTFPHHENEVAQSCGATGKGFARVWLHNGFVNVNKEKMSKSLGNSFTLSEILKSHDPMVVRYFLLSQHYRSPVDYSDEAIQGAAGAWERVAQAFLLLKGWETGDKAAEGPTDAIDQHYGVFLDAMADDFNTPRALASLHGIAKEIFKKESFNARHAAERFRAMMETLGFVVPEDNVWPANVLALRDQRDLARKSKDWKKADEIRQKLKDLGVIVEDKPEGQVLKRT